MFRFSTSNTSRFFSRSAEIEQDPEAPIGKRPVIHIAAQSLRCAVQIRVLRAAGRLVGELGQAFQPELSGGGHLVAFFGEENREEGSGQRGIAAYFGRQP